MGFRFRRSLRIAPGVRLNISRSGLSTTFGARGASVTVGKKGARGNLGIPGTGISYSAPLASMSKRGSRSPAGAAPSKQNSGGCALIAVCGFLLLAVGMCSSGRDMTAPTETLVAQKGYVDTAALNCRVVPDTSSIVVAQLQHGREISISKEADGWSNTSVGGQSCWVSSQYVSNSPPAPVPTAAPPARLMSGSAAASSGRSSSARTYSANPTNEYSDEGCPCSGSQVCIGPRGGRYCITSGGNKRYGV
jgi:hypothetical protein